MLNRLRYCVVRAWADTRSAVILSTLSASTIGAALVVLGGCAMALQNLEGLALVWGRAASVAVYLDDAATPNDREALRVELASLPQVETAVLVAPADALQRFRDRGAREAELVAGISEEILPASVELTLRAGSADVEAMAALEQQIQGRAWVVEVDYGRQEFDALGNVLRLLRYGGTGAAVLMLLVTAFIVSNTIRLTVYARRDEIAILRLVGATAWFVNAPFLLEGALWGALGGIGAAAILWAADVLVAPQATAAAAQLLGGLEIHCIAPRLAAALLLLGAVLGFVGSTLAVLRVGDNPEYA